MKTPDPNLAAAFEAVLIEIAPRSLPDSFAIITAWNPNGLDAALAENEAADEALHALLTQGLDPTAEALGSLDVPFRCTGGNADRSHVEPGWGAAIEFDRAVALATRFQQVGFFWIEAGQLYLVYTHAPEVRECLAPLSERLLSPANSPVTWAELASLSSSSLLDQLCFFPEIGSTNDYALANPSDARRLIWTLLQTKGRGRGSNVWFASPGCLTFTLVLPDLPLDERDIAKVSLVSALAVADAIQPYANPQLKWPNDVYIDDQKVCGILAERYGDQLIVGIGCNVSNDLSGLDVPATTIAKHCASSPRLADVLQSMLTHFEELLELLVTNKIDLPTAWRPRCWLTGKTVEMDSGLVGICLGIQADGGLRLESTDGIQTVYGGIIQNIAP